MRPTFMFRTNEGIQQFECNINKIHYLSLTSALRENLTRFSQFDVGMFSILMGFNSPENEVNAPLAGNGECMQIIRRTNRK